MNPEVVIVGLIALAAGAFIGFSVAKYMVAHPQAEAEAIAMLRADAAKVQAALQNALAGAHSTIQALVAKVERANAPAAPAAAPVAVSAPAVAWSLGDSYSSLGALAADIVRPGFVREVRIDGAPTFNIGGGDPADFYTVGGQLTQTKPA